MKKNLYGGDSGWDCKVGSEEVFVGGFDEGGREGGDLFADFLIGGLFRGDFIAQFGDIKWKEVMLTNVAAVGITGGDPEAHLVGDLGGDGALEGVFSGEEDYGCAGGEDLVVDILVVEGEAIGVPDMLDAIAGLPEGFKCGSDTLGFLDGLGQECGGIGIAGIEGFKFTADGGMAIEEAGEGGAASACGGKEDEGQLIGGRQGIKGVEIAELCAAHLAGS